MSAKIDDDIAKLESQIARGLARDRVARATDASTHLRRAADILSGELRVSPTLSKAAIRLIEAADLISEAIAKGDL